MWKDFEEIHLGPQHEAEEMLRQELRREQIDNEIDKGANYEN